MTNSLPLPPETHPLPPDTLDHQPLLRRSKQAYIKLVLGGLACLSLGALALFATYTALPQSQNLGSRAAANPGKTWVAFTPATIAPNASTLAKPKVIIRKQGGANKISTVHVELTYDASKISNLSAQILDWKPGKPPVVLEPFTKNVAGNLGTASITLGAPCDATQCYPLKKLSNNLLTLNFNASGASTIQATSNSFITLTGLATNTYDQSMSQTLTINATN